LASPRRSPISWSVANAGSKKLTFAAV
jgi:hypothetical protein